MPFSVTRHERIILAGLALALVVGLGLMLLL
jgi:hypothetical protein